LRYAWLKDGFPLEQSEGNYEENEDGTLRIVASNTGDGAGNYTCVVTNGYSQDSATAVISLPITYSMLLSYLLLKFTHRGFDECHQHVTYYTN
jgi:hypothetical protein